MTASIRLVFFIGIAFLLLVTTQRPGFSLVARSGVQPWGYSPSDRVTTLSSNFLDLLQEVSFRHRQYPAARLRPDPVVRAMIAAKGRLPSDYLVLCEP